MGLNDVNITLGQGGLARSLPTEDHVSAVIFDQSPPTSWGSVKTKSFRSLAQLEADGIVESNPTFALPYYTAKEFFRMHKDGELYLFFDLQSAGEFINLTGGRVRQIGIYLELYESSDLNDFAQELEGLKAPVSIIMAPLDITDVTYQTEMIDLHALDNRHISFLIAGDGGAKGAALSVSLGLNPIPNIGAVLGAISSAQVHESVAWVERFDFSDGEEMEQVAMADGKLLDQMLPEDLDFLNDRGYIFFRKYIGRPGVYLNDTFTATALSSDYSNIESNRTIHKASRLLYGAYLPKLNSPLQVDPDSGQLSIDTIKYFETLGDKVLRKQMEAQGELSGFSVTINPEQNILSTSTLQVVVRLVPIGVARNIEISLGFTLSI